MSNVFIDMICMFGIIVLGTIALLVPFIVYGAHIYFQHYDNRRLNKWYKTIRILKEIEVKAAWINKQELDIPSVLERVPSDEGPVMWRYKDKIKKESCGIALAAACLIEKLEKYNTVLPEVKMNIPMPKVKPPLVNVDHKTGYWE